MLHPLANSRAVALHSSKKNSIDPDFQQCSLSIELKRKLAAPSAMLSDFDVPNWALPPAIGANAYQNINEQREEAVTTSSTERNKRCDSYDTGCPALLSSVGASRSWKKLFLRYSKVRIVVMAEGTARMRFVPSPA